MSGNAAFGFYGKLPARGDFVRTGLPRSFVAAWDWWLQGVLPAVLEAIGEGWQQVPAWQFHLAPNLCGADAASGVLLPSWDSVGRLFPLTVAAPGCGSDTDSLILAENIARSAIVEAWAPDALCARLHDIAPMPGPSLPAGMSLWPRSRGDGRVLFLTGLPDPATLISMLREDANAG